jgi:hypothetical protein
MALIKWLLIALSVALGGFVIYEGVTAPHLNPIWPLYAVPAACALNIFYLYLSGPPATSHADSSGPSTLIRLLRLLDLWLAAKEEELKRRAKS